MSINNDYTSKDIKVLSDFEHVRLRTQVFLGNMNPTEYNIPIVFGDSYDVEQVVFIPAVFKAIGEIADNCLDEFAHIKQRNKTLTIDAVPSEGKYTIGDNGRGVPIDMHETGKHTPEVVFGSLRSGRNFTDDKEIGVIGMNGVGSSCVTATSTKFEVSIKRDGKLYEQRFLRGASRVFKPVISKSGSAVTGTTVTFELDPEVFKDVSIPDVLIKNRAHEIAMTNPDVSVVFNGETIRYKKGMAEVIDRLFEGEAVFKFTVSTPTSEGEIYVVMTNNGDEDEQMFTWVNSSYLFDGGKCNTQFLNAFIEQACNHLAPAAKKNKCSVTRNDVREGLVVFANLRVKNPEYDSQAKTRLTGPDMRKNFNAVIAEQWNSYAKKHGDWLTSVLERAKERHHVRENKKAIDDHKKRLHKKVEGLLDATSDNRFDCSLLITEGDSAKGQISEARDPKTIAAFALTGKINNVYGSTPAQVLKMGKVTNLLAAIGLVPGKRAIRSDLRYGKIVIATDADYDGDDIFSTLVNLFYQFWPELFDDNYEPIVYRLVAPNVCLVKGKKRLHFPKRVDYEKVKDKYKGYEVLYYKGLGSMSKTDWEMVLQEPDHTLIPITDDGNMKDVLQLLFSNDSDSRKLWLQTTNNE